MSSFRSHAATFSGSISIAGDPDEVFPLFSPLGEKLWVPGWDPELLHPPGAEWEEGMVFRTREESGPAVWVVSRLERAAHRVRYHRVEPERYVARVDVACRAAGDSSRVAGGAGGGTTEATVSYTFIGLSERGNRDIMAMSQADYVEKMARWERWIASR